MPWGAVKGGACNTALTQTEVEGRAKPSYWTWWGRVGAREGETKNERSLLCPWQQTEVGFSLFPLEPNDDFREFSSLPRLWVWGC